MAHRTLINGTGYDISGGRDLIGGTGYGKKKGRVLVNGTGYDVPFSSGIPIGTLAVGSVVKIGVNGKSYDFLVVNQGIPSNSSLYDSSCNGTWLLMKDIYEKRVWHSQMKNNYEESTINTYLNGEFFNLIDSDARSSIKQIKIPHRKNGGSGGYEQSGENGLPCKVLLLSAKEVGWGSDSYVPGDGAKLDYFAEGSSGGSGRIAKLDGAITPWTLRSPYTGDTYRIWRVESNGACRVDNVIVTNGIRPAFTLPGEFPVVQNADGTYAPA